MKALAKIASLTVFLAALAILPSTLIALRQMAGQVAAAMPRHASAVEAAEFWARALGV